MVKKRFPVVTTVSVILKIAAVLFLIVGSTDLVQHFVQEAKLSNLKFSADMFFSIFFNWFAEILFPAGFAVGGGNHRGHTRHRI